MRIAALPRPNPDRIEALRASMCGWATALLAWFCEVLDALAPAWRRAPIIGEALTRIEAQIAADLRASTRLMRMLLVAAALTRFDVHPPRRRLAPAVRQGSRRRYRRAATRTLLRPLRTGSLRQRAETLRLMLSAPEALIARVAGRLRAMHRRGPIRRDGVRAAHRHCIDGLRDCVRDAISPPALNSS